MTMTALASLANLRDIGGHPTSDGRRVRTGVVLRGEAPALADPDDLAALHEELGVGALVDLRRDEEVALHPAPTPLARVARTHAVPFDTAAPPHVADLSPAGDPVTAAHVGRFYAWMAEHNADRLRQAYAHVVEADEPVLVHCAVGKDRTGVTVALALLALGVDEADVAADYHRSHEAMRRTLPRLHPDLGPGDVDVDVRLGAPIAALTTMLDALRARHGSVEGFWDWLDGDGQLRAGLRERLIAPA